MNTLDIVAAYRSAGPSRARLLVNFAVFQCAWFACVGGAAQGWPWAGSAVAFAVVAVHVLACARPLEELKLAALALLLGAVCDSALVWSGWLSFASGTVIPGLAPVWILAMWALFATTLNLSLAWLKGRWLLSCILGAVSGPLAYWAGVRLGAVTFLNPPYALAALAMEWGAMMPVLLLFARRFDGTRARD